MMIVALALAGAVAGAAEDAAAEMKWVEGYELTLEGLGWPSERDAYRRLPLRMEKTAPEAVWGLSDHSAGLAVRFESDAPSIQVRWHIINPNLAMDHMPATGVSGVDLYTRDGKTWRWIGTGRPYETQEEATLIKGLSKKNREYILYLPLYNGVHSLQVGVPAGSDLRPAAPWRSGRKAVVFYGTSILHGGCASRPGMAYPAIVGRKLEVESINLGFSGAARSEPEMVDILAELNPSVFVIDPLPNMGAVPVEERLTNLLKVLKRKHPFTPVVLVESAGYRGEFVRGVRDPGKLQINRSMRKVYEASVKDWNGLLFYVEGRRLFGSDGEGTVDGVHATDLGFAQMADAITPVVKAALKAGERAAGQKGL